MTTDDDLMAEAIAAADAARAAAPPWPQVGCVIVRDGEIVGVGATGSHPVGPHAEVAALAAAGDRARGATAYTTLEPCDHDGNTPPCSRALIEAGVRRVVVAVEDPDEKVSGRGITRLREAGIAVAVGPGADAAASQLRGYLFQRRFGRPFTVLKTAMSLDGRTTAADGSSQWITGPEARADAHRLRAESHAVLVGPATAAADRPSLTVRDAAPGPWGQPLRVLLDARGVVPVEGPLADPSLAPTLVITTAAAPAVVRRRWDDAGATTVVVAAGTSGHGVDLTATLELLATDHHVQQAMVEGGGRLHGAFLAERHAQELVVYVAPLVLGERGRSVIATPGPETLAAADRAWRVADVARLGGDLRLTYVRAVDATGEVAA